MTKDQVEKLQHFIHRFKTAKRLYTKSKEVTTAPYIYGKAINEFIHYLYDQKLIAGNYSGILKEWDASTDEEFISKLNMEECRLLLTGILRNDRFWDGYIANCIKKGYVEQIVYRLAELTSKSH